MTTEVWKLTSEALNTALSELADNASIHAIGLTGKCIPYIGWYWRTVDFDRFDYTLAKCNSFWGFCENNKWDYKEYYTSEAQGRQIRTLIEAFVVAPDEEKAKAVFDYIQACPLEKTPQ
jgi:hypothetical protein